MRKRKGGLIARFIKLVLAIVVGFLVAAGVFVFALSKTGVIEIGDSDQSDSSVGIVDMLLGKGLNLNVAVLGVDGDETRTDVIFVVHFESKEKKLSLVSVPRDTRVDISSDVRAIIDESGRWYPDYCKINEVHAYAGKENGAKCSVLQLEDLLGIDIDHYVKINIDGFKSVVDMIGGVEVDVPQDMYYVDPYQDLYINLKAGLQTLNGDEAEQLVRFRSYPQGDVQRVQVQQLFLKAFLKKMIDPQTMLTNLTDYIKAAYEYVDTDISLTDALKYVGYIKDIDVNNVNMQTIPGSGQYIGSVSYFVTDKAEARELVQNVFYGEKEDDNVEKSYDLDIEVANGGNVDGLASKTKTKLEQEGYSVIRVINFNGEKSEKTRIYVRKEGVGEDLVSFFNSAEVIVDETLIGDDADILIVLGTKEK